MITILSRRMAAILHLVLLVVLSQTVSAPAAPDPVHDPDGLTSIVSLVQRESMFDPSEALLVGGASQALHAFLLRRGECTALPVQTTIRGFRQEFEQAIARHPEIDRADLWYAAMHGLLQPLEEPYTRFLNPTEYRHLQARVEGTDECGLGCHVELDADLTLTVTEIFDKTPAARAGLACGDRILAVDGRPTAQLSLSAAKDLLAGPEGSRVRVTVRRNAATLELEAQRSRIEIPTVSWEMLPGGVGYIRLRAFSANVANTLDTALEALDRAGAQAYVLDLRDNRGGYVTSAVDVCSRFLPPGSPIMSLEQKRRPTVTYTTYPVRRHAARIIVLVNERSASASEIVAGCLQDHKVATLLGTRTYGKGLVQKVVPLPDGSACTISTGRYRTAAGRDLHKHGIPPDVLMPQTTYTVAARDPLVCQAAAILRQRQGGVSSTTH